MSWRDCRNSYDCNGRNAEAGHDRAAGVLSDSRLLNGGPGAIEKDPDGAVHRSWAYAFRWLLFQISRPRPGVDGEDYEARCEWLRKDFQLKVTMARLQPR